MLNYFSRILNKGRDSGSPPVAEESHSPKSLTLRVIFHIQQKDSFDFDMGIDNKLFSEWLGPFQFEKVFYTEDGLVEEAWITFKDPFGKDEFKRDAFCYYARLLGPLGNTEGWIREVDADLRASYEAQGKIRTDKLATH